MTYLLQYTDRTSSRPTQSPAQIELDTDSESSSLTMAKTLTSPIPFADPAWHTATEHPFYNDSHRALQRFVREYVDRDIMPYAGEWERQGFVPDEVCISDRLSTGAAEAVVLKTFDRRFSVTQASACSRFRPSRCPRSACRVSSYQPASKRAVRKAT